MSPFESYDDLLERVESLGRSVRRLGHTPDGSPLVAVECGGDKLPAVFISAGSHSTEQAGVTAAVELIGQLQTDHRVVVLPCRDPIGMGGYAHALQQGLGAEPGPIQSFDAVEEILRAEGEILFEEGDILLALIGDYGYALSRPTADGLCAQFRAYRRLQQLEREESERVIPLRGRRIYMTPGQEGVEGTGDFGRAYTLVVSPAGEILHLNRFHDTAWAPVEARCVRSLLAEIRPGIGFDLHESQFMDDRYWLSARHQADPENEAWEHRVATATIGAVEAAGATLAADEDVIGLSTVTGRTGATLADTWFRKTETGVYWLDASIRGEGFNLADFISCEYGLAFGTEMGMYGSFDHRVKLALTTVRAAVAEFAKRYI